MCIKSISTVIIFVATLFLVMYSLFLDSPEDISVEDLIDFGAIEEEVESGNPVRIISYKSPIDERLFVPWPPGANFNPFVEKDPVQSFFNQKTEVPCYKQKRSTAISKKYNQIWKAADRMITKEGLWKPDSPQFRKVLDALATACLVDVDLLDIGEYESGTSEKWIGTLQGGQKVVLKVLWETKGDMKRGGLCNDGFEMPTSEIAAFHLHKILGFFNTPYVIGRKFDLLNDILPYASSAVARQIKVKSTLAGAESCLTGFCFTCARNHTICPRDNIVEVSVAYWIYRRLHLHTYPGDYMPFSTAGKEKWENIGFNDKSYCKEIRRNMPPYDEDQMYYDLFDYAVLDTLTYHYDSKHYTVDDSSSAAGLTVRLDHGRAFCSYDKNEEDLFLAPLHQCCTLRRSTYDNLLMLRDGKLSRQMRSSLGNDPIAPVLKPAWFPVLDKRLQMILELVEKCFRANGVQNVLV